MTTSLTGTAANVGVLPPPYALYWERLDPRTPGNLPPILMLPGGGASGACYRMTPDGRQGWADYFRDIGHTVFTTDWPGQGRSGYIASQHLSYEFAAEAMAALVTAIGAPNLVIFTHSMSGIVGWKLLELVPNGFAQIVAIAPGPPGNVQPQPVPVGTNPEQARIAGEIVTEAADYVHIRFRQNDFFIDFNAHASDVTDYLVTIGIGNSRRYDPSWLPVWKGSTLHLPPRLLAQRLNYRGSALAVSDDADFRGKAVLIVTGDTDVAHSRGDDGGTAAFLSSLGAKVDFLWLGDMGISGNGHYLMYEDNSLEIAAILATKIAPGSV